MAYDRGGESQNADRSPRERLGDAERAASRLVPEVEQVESVPVRAVAGGPAVLGI
jgi:hypothetical protein